MEDFWAVVPAGGAGTRLWPLSRSAEPKFLLDLTGTGRTLIQATVDRLSALAGDRVLVVTGEVHRERVVAQLPELAPDQVVGEPSPKDSMAAIGLAAAILERRQSDVVMGSFAADHAIGDPEAFDRLVRAAVTVAREDWLVTIGVEPDHPATGFGYIRLGDSLAGHRDARQATAFVEKPSQATARQYLDSGEYRWNAGMFVVRPTVLLELLADSDPEFAAELRRIAAAPALLRERWGALPRISVDHAVAEPAAAAGRVAVVPGQFGWSDIGDFAALGALIDHQTLSVLGDSSTVRQIDSSGFVAPHGDRMVAVLGLKDVVVVETADALLVTSLDRAQDVKQMVDALRASGRLDLT